ncbi:MAG TPA: hypothetical protein VKH37_02505 [Ferruginibacter sp.]|nr:hypothetical protein [Ferruginibacter sp.]
MQRIFIDAAVRVSRTETTKWFVRHEPWLRVFDAYSTAKRNNALLLYARQKDLDPSYVVTEGDQRGNPSHKDSYFSFNVKIGYIFGREKRQ